MSFAKSMRELFERKLKYASFKSPYQYAIKVYEELEIKNG